MADTPHNTAGSTRHASPDASGLSGGVIFAGVLMLVVGTMSILVGIGGIAEDDVYARVGDYVYEFDLTTWGWIHLVLGALVALTGLGVLAGAPVARGVGVALAVLVAIAQFMWLPYQPIWSVVVIAIAVFIIWALTTDTGRKKAF
ncbi:MULTISPECIES: DUF7144 family membrane protein [unclassified Streptomyces]|uniref:DUF7144 family membrane protein n=1 Tax=unclassified Streptomyces TaxID=2593676 RepID=UPI0022B735FB|nr:MULTISPECIES: hypothetical protein [unclassified Streptomyces]MCZ7413931.1 hypothetical protein [Streptomyces sp. WMMC897]MCZ7430927.1 hypothetical protein [Streptomyces sp. WMMC1477]